MKHILTIGLGCLLVVTACSKKEEAQQTETVPSATTTVTEITMLEHLQSLNGIMCDAMVAEQPGKTKAECVEQLNDLSEMNPQNKRVMVHKQNSVQCAEYLQTIKGSDVIIQSTSGLCALSALQGS